MIYDGKKDKRSDGDVLIHEGKGLGGRGRHREKRNEEIEGMRWNERSLLEEEMELDERLTNRLRRLSYVRLPSHEIPVSLILDWVSLDSCIMHGPISLRLM